MMGGSIYWEIEWRLAATGGRLQELHQFKNLLCYVLLYSICDNDGVSGERWRCTADRCEPSCTHSGAVYHVGEALGLPMDRVTW